MTFGISNLIALRLNIIANPMDRIEIAVAVRNMRLYESAEGKYCTVPFTFNID
ncbi:MAG TPA: hypothetical protein VEL11_08125 [Candidatus Bathyarchaeia archaeon]|nr:hypothetical protein [Candidatus Bathyarchaeia archaeon]